MNSENFHEYLKNPSMLYQVTYQELKSLALQYPYSPNLRYMLLLKSLLDNHREHDKNLALAALYSLDRRQLYGTVRAHEKVRDLNENYALHEEYLELKDLSNIEEILENQPLAGTETPIRTQMERMEDSFEKDAIPGTDKDAFKTDLEQTDNLEFLENLFEKTEPFDAKSPAATAIETAYSLENPATLEDVLAELAAEPEADAEPAGTLEDALEATVATQEIEDESVEPVAVQEESLERITNEAAVVEPIEHLETLEEVPGEITAEAEAFVTPDETAEDLKAVVATEVETAPEAAKPLLTLEEILETSETAANSQDLPPVIADERPHPVKPAPKSAFGSWQSKALGSGNLLGVNPKPGAPPIVESKPAPRPMPRNEAKTLAAKSISEDAAIASAPLAAILEAQGHSERAIAMYEKLSLLHPEKSSFFAAKIEKIKS